MPSLLLDSAGRSDGRVDENSISHAKIISPGDPDCFRWYALRVSYSRELKLQQRLDSAGVKTFIPMKTVREEKKGRVLRRSVPAINNLVFAFSSRKMIDDYLLTEGESRMTHFIWDPVTRNPLIVPHKQMEDFIRISTVSADDVIYLSEISQKLRDGSKVRVRRGALEGVEGTVVRIKKSRRILVEIPGVISIASAYVPMEDLELLP